MLRNVNDGEYKEWGFLNMEHLNERKRKLTYYVKKYIFYCAYFN
jgi:hypothetical protein